MSLFIARLAWNAPSQPTNIVGIALSLIPGDTTLQFDVWRAPDASGSPGTFIQIGTAGPFSQAGGIFLDQLPSTTAVWWYKVRHIGPTVDPGAFTAPISSTPYVIRKAIYDAWVAGTNVYPLQRPRAWSDGSYAATAQSNDGMQLHANVTDSGGSRKVNRFLAKVATGDPDSTDGVPDGTVTTRNYQYENGGDIAVDNANFENAATGSGMNTVPGWFGTNATLSLVGSGAQYAGNQSLHVANSAQYGAAMSVKRYNVRPGDVWKVSVAMKAGTASDTADAQLMFLDANGVYQGGLQPATVSTTWTLQSITGAVPANAVYAQWSLQNNRAGAGDVYFDSIQAFRVRTLDDETQDGSTYSRTLGTRVNAGRPLIDFSEGIHLNKVISWLADGGGFSKTQSSDMTGNRINLVPRSFRWEGQGRTAIQNLTYEIPNSEFDVWETATQPHAWTVDTGDSSSAAQDTTNVFSGDSSCEYLFGGGGAAGDFHGLTTNDPTKGAWCIPLQPQTWYRLKFPTRASTTGCSYRVTLDHNSSSPGTLTTQQTFTINAANTWQVDVLMFMVPATAKNLTKLAVEFCRNSTTATNFWIDGIRMIEIGTQRQILLTSGTTWTVPNDFNPNNNTVELWGPGGNGAAATANANGGGGGGGGGYRYIQNFNPGTSTSIPYVIGTGGSGTNTSWNGGIAVANAGSNAAGSTNGTGGGGSGGGGGGSGGAGGAGRVGTGSSGGGGGGGAGGFAGNGAAGSAGTNAAGGAGGTAGSGTVVNPGLLGGAGGSGGSVGSSGNDGNEYSLITAGAGGGGGGSFNPTAGGQGGHYGGGGGGAGCSSSVAGSSSPGQQGCIVITYITPA